MEVNLDDVLELIKKSRTVEEGSSEGRSESIARSQAAVDLLAHYSKHLTRNNKAV